MVGLDLRPCSPEGRKAHHVRQLAGRLNIDAERIQAELEEMAVDNARYQVGALESRIKALEQCFGLPD